MCTNLIDHFFLFKKNIVVILVAKLVVLVIHVPRPFSLQDMVLLHHEVQIEFPDGRPTENHWATLLEFGKVEDGKATSAMALTVGIPAAIGVLVIPNSCKFKCKKPSKIPKPLSYLVNLKIAAPTSEQDPEQRGGQTP